MKKQNFLNLVRFLPLIGFLLVICLYFVIHKPFDGSFISRAGMCLWVLFIAFALSASAGGSGRWLQNRLHLEKKSSVISFAIGLGSLSLIFMLVGMVIGIRAWWVWTVILAISIVFHKHILGWVNEVCTEIIDIWRLSTNLGKTIGWISLIIVISTLIIAFTPPTKFDALVYHLALPRQYIESGSLGYLPGNMFWGMPQLGEMLFTWALILAGERAAVCLGWMVGVITLWGVLHFATLRFTSTIGWVAIAALLSGTTLSVSLSWGYIDWFTILFGLGVLIMLDQWIETGGRTELILTGVLAGFCLGCKYTAGVIILAAMAVIIWRIISKKRINEEHNGSNLIVFGILHSLFIFGVTVVIITLPWWVKNLLATGNPFYPFFFPSGAMDAFRLDSYQIPASTSIWQTILLPFSATFLGVEGAPGFSASIGPLLLGLGLFAWLPQPSQTKNQKHTARLCLVIVLSGLLVWMIGSRFSDFLIQSRMYFSIFPALAILSGLGFNGFSQLRPFGIRFQNIIGALIILCLGFSALEVSTYAVKIGSLNYLANLESEDDYLGGNLGWYYPAVHEITNKQRNSKVLLLFEPRGYFCLPYCDSDEILDQWKHDLYLYENPSDVLKAWKDQGFTDVMFNRFGADFVKASDSRYQSQDWEKLDELLSELSTTENIGDAYYLYSLTP